MYRHIIPFVMLTTINLAATARLYADEDMSQLGVFEVSKICAAQDPHYQDGLYARSLSSTPGWRGWGAYDQRPLSRCLKQRQWAPPELCRSVTALREGTTAEAHAWIDAHHKVLFRLRTVFDYVGEVEGGRRSSEECPEITPAPGTEMGELGITAVFEACVAQEPRYRTGRFSQVVARNLGLDWTWFDGRALAKCLQQRRWLSPGLCQSLDRMPVNDKGSFEPATVEHWTLEHAKDLKSLESVFDFINDAEKHLVPDSACPILDVQRDR